MNADVIELEPLAALSGRRVAAEEAIQAEDALKGELRRARRRIAQLERNLVAAMRDSLVNYRRAEEAERRLADADT